VLYVVDSTSASESARGKRVNIREDEDGHCSHRVPRRRAISSKPGTGIDGRPLSAIAREYRAQGKKWVIVGDANYGEGSSREHAALSPRLLNCAAVIARSFARIHETNLKKQGLLALTFTDSADYDRIKAHDRLSLVGLAELAPGKPVRCLVQHADDTQETLLLQHSYTTAQLAWFRAGSALNLCRAGA
jgi:aconitate hydratase